MPPVPLRVEKAYAVVAAAATVAAARRRDDDVFDMVRGRGPLGQKGEEEEKTIG
jgi:hypothetical protein